MIKKGINEKAEAAKPYSYQEYPKMVCHKDYKPVIVKSQSEKDKKGEDWEDAPGHFANAPFPKYIQHKIYKPMIVESAEEHKELGADYGYGEKASEKSSDKKSKADQ